MVSKVRGHFTSRTGQIATADNPADSTVTASIDISSIDTANEMRDNHIRSAGFFDAGHHPVMTFTSTGVRVQDDAFFIDGDLTIRGTTKPLSCVIMA